MQYAGGYEISSLGAAPLLSYFNNTSGQTTTVDTPATLIDINIPCLATDVLLIDSSINVGLAALISGLNFELQFDGATIRAGSISSVESTFSFCERLIPGADGTFNVAILWSLGSIGGVATEIFSTLRVIVGKG